MIVVDTVTFPIAYDAAYLAVAEALEAPLVARGIRLLPGPADTPPPSNCSNPKDLAHCGSLRGGQRSRCTMQSRTVARLECSAAACPLCGIALSGERFAL